MFEHKKSFFDGFSSKTSFFLGLIAGILVVSSVGFFVLLGVNAAGKAGNQPSANLQNDPSGQVLGNQAQGNPSAEAEPQVSSVRAVSKDDHIRGADINAPIKIIEYSDFQCPFCKMVDPTLKQLVADYPGKVTWIYRHFPLTSLHPFAQKAAEASECASEQGKFWEYSDKLYANQQLFSNDYFSQLAGEMKLDQSKFDSCLTSGKYAKKVNTDAVEAVNAGLKGTPGLFVNDQFIKGALPYENFQQIIDSMLN